MRRDRLSVAAPMAIIVVLSVELAALNWGTGAAVDISRLLTVLLLGIATCLARYRSGDEGAWWFGFTLFGWAYYVLMLDAMWIGRPFAGQSVVSFLPTTIMNFWISGSPAGSPVIQQYVERLRILHEMVILVVAIIGGIVCWMIERRRRPSGDDRT